MHTKATLSVSPSRVANCQANDYFIGRPVRAYLVQILEAEMRIFGLILRTLFLSVVVVVTARVAAPQNETLLSAYDTPADLLRIVLGAIVCGFVAVQIFRYSRNPADMRKWVPMGLALLPLAVLCAVVIW